MALRKGWTHYGPSAGLPQLRETIAQYVSETHRVNVTPEEVVVVPGGKPIIFFTILALVEEGDEVIYPNPGFPIYESMINYVGAKAVPIQLREEMDFRLDVDELGGLINDRTKLIILNSPQNPTGGVLTKIEDIDGIARAIGDRNIMVLTDEIYSRLIFEGEHHSIMSVDGMKERCILLDGFSKTYAMTGWRMGYGVMRADLATHVARLMTNSNSCTASFTQVAGIEALRGAGFGRRHVRRVQETARRDGRRPEQDQRFLLPLAQRARSTFSPTSRRPDGRRRNWPTRCSTMPASPRCPGPPSAISAKAICASAWPTRSRTCSRRSTASTSGRRRTSSLIGRPATPLRPLILDFNYDSSSTGRRCVRLLSGGWPPSGRSGHVCSRPSHRHPG